MRADDSPDFRPPGRAARSDQARLAILADFTPQGDRTFDHFFARLAGAIASRGWGVEVTFAAPGPEPYRNELQREGVELAWLRFPFGTRSATELAGRLLRRRGVVLQAHFLGSFEPRLLAFRATGLVRKLQVVDHLSGDLRPLGGAREVVRRMRGRVAGAVVDEYVAVSRFVADRIARAGVPARRVRIIENGIPVERYAPTGPPALRERPCVVFAGQLIPEKGVHVLLEAARTMPAAADWVIAGAGRHGSELEALARRLGVPARFVGHVNSAALFRGADVVVVPSLWEEAFGLVAVEGMAAGAAVVVSDAGGLPEVVGETGVVVPRGDAVALRAVLERLLHSSSERARLGGAALRRAASRFTLERMVSEHVDAAEKLLREASVRRAG